MYKYFPHTAANIQEMLAVVGSDTLDQLYCDVPEHIIYNKEYNLNEQMSEQEIRNYFNALAEKNQKLCCFAGAGAYDHYTPSVISYLTNRSEFQTAYTPYQPEISQGTLRYIFEFQSMICNLTGMDVANASMYDGATATAEAVMMMVASAKGGAKKVLVSATLNPLARRVVDTYAKFHGIELQTIKEQDGATSLQDMECLLAQGGIAGVILQQPNIYGIIEDYSGFADRIHNAKALLAMNVNPSALAVIKTPAELGADIVCGDGQSLGIPLTFGGPYVGFMACRKDLVRKMPGRIVGATTDTQGRRAFVLTLQAREQHIRRNKATSNICSNQSLMALWVTIYLSIMGKEGLKEVNDLSYCGAHYLFDSLMATGKFSKLFDKPFLNEFAVDYKGDAAKLQKFMIDNGILAGVRLKDIKADAGDSTLLFAVTEQRTKEEIDNFVKLINQAAL